MAATGSVALTFPDGARREYPKGITGFDVAKAISPSLPSTVAMALDGALADLADPIAHDAKIEFDNRDDPRRWKLSATTPPCAGRSRAIAVARTQVTSAGDRDGFYYDSSQPAVHPGGFFAAIEKRMREIIAATSLHQGGVAREQAKRVFRDKGELFKVELVDAIRTTGDKI